MNKRVLIAAVVSSALGCAPSTRGTPSAAGADDGLGDGDGGDRGGGGTGGDTGSDDAGEGGETGQLFDVGAGDDGGLPSGPVCSSDLKRVEDSGTGAVLEECGPELGCLEGECVEVCEAAAGSSGSIGCDFIVPTSPFYGNGELAEQAGPCHALMVANTWDAPAKIELSRGGETFDVTAHARLPNGVGPNTTYDTLPPDGVPPGAVAVVFLAHKPGTFNYESLECPVPPAVLADTAAAGTGRGVAFEVRSDVPVQVYDIIPFGGAASYLPSASLLYPTTTWGTDYLVVNPHDDSEGSSWMLAVAVEDQTQVSLTTNQPATFVSGVEAPVVGSASTYMLDAGETVQFSSLADPTGSVIVGDKPIGVLAGNTYLKVFTADSVLSGQDSAHQMLPDAHAVGSSYVGAGVPSRLASGDAESVLYRLVGMADGTQLSWDPIVPPGAPTSLANGQVAEVETRALFSVQSQDAEHPFSVTQYMSGAIFGGSGCFGDPSEFQCSLGDDEWVLVVPEAQFLESYSFFVDPTYGKTGLTITRIKGRNGFAEVEVGCLGVVDGWKKAGTDGRYEVAHVELFHGTEGPPACRTSQHTAWSTEPFGLAVWGVDAFASYAYPGGAMLRDINDIYVTPPAG
ncbi:MAG: IgGFc-binding protein [Myxococcota bacterium]